MNLNNSIKLAKNNYATEKLSTVVAVATERWEVYIEKYL